MSFCRFAKADPNIRPTPLVEIVPKWNPSYQQIFEHEPIFSRFFHSRGYVSAWELPRSDSWQISPDKWKVLDSPANPPEASNKSLAYSEYHIHCYLDTNGLRCNRRTFAHPIPSF